MLGFPAIGRMVTWEGVDVVLLRRSGPGHPLRELVAMPTQEQIREALKVVIDPELRHNIVDLGMVRSIEPVEGGRVNVVVSLTTPGCPVRAAPFTAPLGRGSALTGFRPPA